MAEYGGNENYDDILGRLNAAEDAVDGLIAKEQRYRGELADTTKADAKGAEATERRRRAQQETVEVKRRAKAVEDVEVRTTNQSTDAIERNARARERLNRVARDSRRALTGAQDPAFGRAFEMHQQGRGTQYAFRKELDQVGSRRARAMQEAIAGGYRPSAGSDKPQGPITRVTAAERAMVQADTDLADAKRQYASATRRKTATDEEREASFAAREKAAASRRAAKLELDSARTEAAAREANAAAARQEAVARQRLTATAVTQAKVGGGPYPGQLALPAAGQTAQMTPAVRPRLYRSQRIVTPGDPRIIEGGGAGGRYGGGSKIHDEAVNAQSTARAVQEKAAAERASAAAQEQQRANRIGDYYKQAQISAQAETRAVTQQGVAFGTTSQAMYRHGALTSEFIAAAARGETTLKELGNQAVITAGKFGGWTAAATALYGAAGAIAEVGRGAINANDGVQQLTRVINNVPKGGQAEGVLADLAGEFNVPIDVAADAVYRMGQRYHDFDDAVTAARASLYAFKTGEVDVETSTRQLISATSGFGLSANELASSYDQINQAQNVFGVKVGETTAGISKAAGAFANAGGDFDHLLALIVAINRATGVTGSEVGTAISRAVTQIRVPTHITKLRDLGVDVDPSDLQATILDAMRVVREAPAGQRDELSNTLASQIFGNQYARQLAPVLRNQQVFNEALRDTSPEKAKGSAQRELAKVLGEVREQMAAIQVGLQQLGQGLAEAGAFTPLYGLLKLLNSALDVVNGMVDAFNQIPQPLRQALMLLGQGYILLQGMRRLGVTDKLLGGPMSSLANPDRRLQIFSARGLRDARDELRNDVERSGRGVYQSQVGSALAARKVAQYEPEVNRALKMADDSEERARILARAEVYETQAAAASGKAISAERELLEKKRIAYGLERQLATVESLRPAQVSKYLRENNIPIPRELAAPNMRGITYLDQVNEANRELAESVEREYQSAAAAGGIGGRGGTTGDRLSSTMRRESGRIERATRASMVNVALGYGQMRDGLARVSGSEVSRTGRVAGALERTAARSSGLMLGAARNIDGVAKGLRGGAGALRGLVSSFGILDIALIAYLALETISGPLEKAIKREEALTHKILHDAKTLAGQRERLKELQKEAKGAEGIGTLDEVLRGAGELLNPKNIYGALKGDYKSPVERRRELGRLSEKELDNLIRRQQTQNEARRQDKPVPFLYSKELIREIDNDQKARRDGIISQREFDRRMSNHAEEAKKLLDGNRRNRFKVATKIAEARRSEGGESYAQSLRDLDKAGLDKEMQAQGALIGMQGLGGGNLDKLKTQYAEAQRRWGKSNKAGDIMALSQARQNYYQTLIGEVNRELQAALLGARSEAERRAAFDRARQRYRDAASDVRKRGHQEREQQRDLQQARKEYTGPQPDLDAPKLGATPPNQLQGTHPFADKKEQERQKNLQAFYDVMKAHGAKKSTLERIKELQGMSGDEVEGFTNRIADHSAQMGGAVFRLRGDDDRARAKNRRERSKKVKEAVKKKDQELTQAERELQVMAYEDRQQGRQIKSELEISETRDAGEQANIRVRYARIQVRDAQREFGNKSRQYRQALIELNTARQAQADQIVADVEADNALLLARAGSDPAAQARAAVQAARNTLEAMRRAGADPNAIKQQQAEVINARNQQEEQQRQEAEQIAGLQSQIAQARAHGDPLVAARAAQRAARAAMGRARTRVERLQATLDLINANNQMEEALREREQARTDLLNSQTEDPLVQSRNDLRQARRNLRGTTGVGRIRARAEYNRARQNYRNQRIDSRLDDINFNLEMDKISNEEAAKQIEDLAKMKGISKARKRDLLLQAKRLREEATGEYELDLGNIKMPTLYEVRRFVQGGMPNSSQVVTDNRQFTVYLGSADAAREFATQLERTNGQSAKATARSMGAR